MSAPLFPDLLPKLIDPVWFNVDKPMDDDNELNQLEAEHTSWLNSIQQKNCDVLPIGKTQTEPEEEEEEEDEDDNDTDTDTHDDDEEEEIEMEIAFDQDSSHVDVSVRLGSGTGSVR